MLSYMLPVEDKPPPVPNKGRLQLDLEELGESSPDSPDHLHQHQQHQQQLTNGGPAKKGARCGGAARQVPATDNSISKESSVSSFVSDITTATATSQSSMTPTSTVSDKPKTKLLTNGTKHTTLKRVSFGSSKGSMVETLIYESPLQEEPEVSPTIEYTCPFPADVGDQTEAERSKVRVTFYQQSKPQVVSPSPASLLSPDGDLLADVMAAATAQPLTAATATITDPASNHIQYSRQESTDSGWENPFRPGGELSREADELIELIKGGKPITPTPGSTAPPLPSVDETDAASGASSPVATPASTADAASPLTQSPKKATNLNSAAPGAVTKKKAGVNGSAPVNNKPSSPGAVDVKRDNVAPGDASQIEHVVLKKKPKCKCCVIQ